MSCLICYKEIFFSVIPDEQIELPLYYENFDLDNVVSPVDTEVLEKLLIETKYDKVKTQWLVSSFREGFDIGYRGDQSIKMKAPNLKFKQVGNPTTLWNKVMKEVKAKRYAGPFDKIPFDNFIQSPIGLVPKDGGRDTRLIFHLSYPRAKGTSLNANTPKELCSVKYPDFSKAIELCRKAGVNCKLSKSDMKSAFRNLGVLRKHWRWLVMKAQSPIDSKTYYFVDKCLPFGAAISCSHFQTFSDAVAHIIKYKTRQENVNYLDDFLFIALLEAFCNAQINLFLEVCEKIKFPVSIEKTFFSSTQMVFLGFLIDTVAQLVMVPQEKIKKGIDLITAVLTAKKGKITLKQLQKICGFLNFLGRAIVPGCTFTRRLYSFTSGGHKLMPHHHIRVNSEMKADLNMWLQFLNHPSAYACGFMDFSSSLIADEIAMFSDASKKKLLGYGGICGNSWLFGQWPTGFIEAEDPSIAYLELYALTATVLSWISRFANKRVILFCDNQSVVQMINTTSSTCGNCMKLMCILVLKCLKENVRVFARYIKSKDNKASDYLSRLKIKEFLDLSNNWDGYPTETPTEIRPITKVWSK